MDGVRRRVAAAGVNSPFREEARRLEENGITRAAVSRLGRRCKLPFFLGESDIATAGFIRDAVKQALDDGRTFYAHSQGLPELRQAVGAYLHRLYGREIDTDRITVPGSAMLGVTLAAHTALSRGDHGLIVCPAWPNIDAVFRVTGAKIGYVPQRMTRHGWQLDPRELFASVRGDTRAIYVNSPCNPTGWVMSPREQRLLLDFCRERNILLISDEVYHRTCFEGDPAPSFLEVAGERDPLVVVNGFSKAWAMTGWRLGWMVTPLGSGVSWSALSESYNTGATVFAQYGGIAALERGEPFVRDLRERFRKARAIVDAALIGHELIDYRSPAGAFFAFPRIRGLENGPRFVQELLAEEDVGLAPGHTFGPGFESHVRLSFARPLDALAEGVKRLVRFVEKR